MFVSCVYQPFIVLLWGKYLSPVTLFWVFEVIFLPFELS